MNTNTESVESENDFANKASTLCLLTPLGYLFLDFICFGIGKQVPMLRMIIGLLSIIFLIAGIVFAIIALKRNGKKSTRKAVIGLIINGFLLWTVFSTASDRIKKAEIPKETSYYYVQNSSGFQRKYS